MSEIGGASGIFQQVSISSDGTLTIVLTGNDFGKRNFSVTAQDSGGGTDTSIMQVFTVQVQYVNRAPIFELASTDIQLEEDSSDCSGSICCRLGACNYSNFALNFYAGPLNDVTGAPNSNELSQNIVFEIVTNFYELKIKR